MKTTIISIALIAIMKISSAQNNILVGEWTLISIENTNADSSKSYPYGDAPQGLLIFEPNGDYAIQILRAVRPKVASNNKSTATPEESIALVQGANSHYGQYIVDEQKHTITYKVAHAFFPNWEGKDLTTIYTLQDDILKSYSTNTTNGGASAVITWKRKK